MGYKIITDAGCDLPKGIIDKYGLKIIPFSITDGYTTYRSDEISPDEIMKNMRMGKSYKTSQATLIDCMSIFEEYAKNGDDIIYIAFSSGLSGTYQTSIMAKNEINQTYPNFKIEIIDSLCASLGMGLVVYKALLLKENDASFEEVVEKTRYNLANMEHIFTVDNLEYLFRGGRVSRASAIIGGMLGINPILHVDDDGHLIPIEKQRGRINSIKRLAEIAGEKTDDLKEQMIGISHCDDIAAAMELKQIMTDKYNCNDFVMCDIGATIGAHSGPGTLALFFLSK